MEWVDVMIAECVAATIRDDSQQVDRTLHARVGLFHNL